MKKSFSKIFLIIRNYLRGIRKAIKGRKIFVVNKNSYCEDEIAFNLKEFGLKVHPALGLENALKLADRDAPLLITGSLYLAGHTLKFNETKID